MQIVIVNINCEMKAPYRKISLSKWNDLALAMV